MFQGHRRSKGFRVSRDRGFPLIDRGFQWDWRFQNLRVSGKYVKGLPKMFQGCQKAKGFRVARDRGFPLAGWGIQVVWRFQNPRVSGKIYRIWAWPKISSYVHSEILLRAVLFMGKTTPIGERTPRREDIFKYGNFLFDIPLLLHFWLFSNLGLLYRFLTTPLGCYSLRISCNLSRGR